MTDIYIIMSWYSGEGTPDIEVCTDTINLAGAAFEAGEAGKKIRIFHIYETLGAIQVTDVTGTWKKREA